jgi:lipoprotein-anchoring transpeptidase ErfK/SrfK
MLRFRFPLVGAVLALALFLAQVPGAYAQGARSIDVNLSTQRATAYEGSTPVYTALVTTGRPGWPTPTGDFAITYRVYDETMSSAGIGIPPDAPGGYYLTGVLYTQYIDWNGDALHYNYWSPASDFGSVPTSHGCVGMQLADAAFFWNFADIGTPVHIHY